MLYPFEDQGNLDDVLVTGDKPIGRQARRRGFSTLCFYNNSPMMSRPYFEVLSHSGLSVIYHTRLPEAS